MTTPTATLEIRSLVKASGELELSLVEAPLEAPGPEHVVVRVEAAPINPSDLALLVAGADLATATATTGERGPVVTAKIPAAVMRGLAARVDQSMPVGNEGAGTVVAAGSAPAAQALLGRKVAILGGGSYTQFRRLHVAQVRALPEGLTAADGASAFVNPLTSLGMVETMRREGHSALCHTAAASNLGQMLNRVCQADGVGLVNIVRKPEQAALLRSQGAVHVVDSSAPGFMSELIEALAATRATLAFDAIGGGPLASQILTGMEAAANRDAKTYSRYGSSVHKQVYIYGALDRSPTELTRNFGLAWSVGGWLLTPFLQKIGADRARELEARVLSELKTTFASHYTQQISLTQALAPDTLRAYARAATGEKYLLVPSA
jgi:NADPH:quinone reductase